MFGAMSLGEAPQGQAAAFKPRRRNELYTSVVLARETRDKLKLLKRTLGFRAYDPLLNYMALEVSKGSLIPPASYEQVFDRLGTRPCIITGESGSGKSTLVRGLLSEWDGDVFALDTTGQDYPDLRRVDLGGFFGLKWGRAGQRVRFVPNANVEISRAEAATVFSHLNFVKNSGELKTWVIAIDEAHRYSSDANLRALLIEARKFTRKVLLVTTDWRVYEGICPSFKPPPWEAGAPEAPPA
jgi:hypothetical protein